MMLVQGRCRDELWRVTYRFVELGANEAANEAASRVLPCDAVRTGGDIVQGQISRDPVREPRVSVLPFSVDLCVQSFILREKRRGRP